MAVLASRAPAVTQSALLGISTPLDLSAGSPASFSALAATTSPALLQSPAPSSSDPTTTTTTATTHPSAPKAATSAAKATKCPICPHPHSSHTVPAADSDDADKEPPQRLQGTPFATQSQPPFASANVTAERQLRAPGNTSPPTATKSASSSSTTTTPKTSSSTLSASSFSSLVSSPSNLSTSPISPLRQFPTSEVEVHDTIPEEDSDDGDDYDTPNEPLTPVDGRQSREGFLIADIATSTTAGTAPIAIPNPNGVSHHPQHHTHHDHHQNKQNHHKQQHGDSNTSTGEPNGIFADDFSVGQSPSASSLSASSQPSNNGFDPVTAGSRTYTNTTVRPESSSGRRSSNTGRSFQQNGNDAATVSGSYTESSSLSVSRSNTNNLESSSPNQPRRIRTNTSSASFKRTMSSLFRRSGSHTDKNGAFGVPDYGTSRNLESNMNEPNRRWSMNRSLASSHAHSPPSPGSPPLEMAYDAKKRAGTTYAATTAAARNGGGAPANGVQARSTMPLPSEDDFLKNDSKKHRQRAATGLSLHNAIHIVTGSSGGGRRNKNTKVNKHAAELQQHRRANSFDHGKHTLPADLGGLPWGLPAEAGTGLKARRMSLNLPDDFTVDICDLHEEFEYQHMMGRHRRHLGKGATSKVTLMFRKDFPDELYAVKEFRGKSSSETREEYEKKVKSEYSIAKSLHHPNIVETVRLCTDHGRWNHVMEYCAEGDLFSLVSAKYLQKEEREKDRLCLFKQMVQGVNYLHAHGIAHRDIKLENLLITSNSKLKITDFGASDVFCGIHPGLREAGGQCGSHMDGNIRFSKPGICGSMPYIAPEVLANKDPYDPRKLDVWACAVVMLHIVFGGALWTEARETQANYKTLVQGWEKHHRRLQRQKEKEEAEKNGTTEVVASNGDKDVKNVKNAVETKVEETANKVSEDSNGTGDKTLTENGTTDEKKIVEKVNGASVDGSVVVEAETEKTNGNPNSIVEGPYPKVIAFDQCVNPPILRRLLLQMLNPDPKERVTIAQVCNLRWFRNIECCQAESYEETIPSIDASKRRNTVNPGQKIFFHDHLPQRASGHSIGRV